MTTQIKEGRFIGLIRAAILTRQSNFSGQDQVGWGLIGKLYLSKVKKRPRIFHYLDFGVFKKIRDYEKFKKARVAFDTIEWDEGVDLDPEFIYAKSKPTSRAA